VAIASDTKTVVGVFNSVSDAQAAVRELESQGIPRDDISLVANKNAVGYDTMDPADRDKASDVVADAGIGAAIGGVGGLLLSAAGALTIPVIGPILAAGPIAAALAGAGIGAAAGGLIGALTESGVPEEDAKYYAEGVRRGDVLVTVRTDQVRADTISDILDRHNAVDVDDRVQNWKNRGWSGYSNDASPYSDEELRNERRQYSITGRSLTGETGIGVDRARSQYNREVPGTEATNLASDVGTSGVVGTTGMTGAGLAGTETDYTTSGRGTSDVSAYRDRDRQSTDTGHHNAGDSVREGMHEAGDKMREWGRDIKDTFRGAGHKAHDEVRSSEHSIDRETSSWNPGNPERGNLGDRTRDNLAEAGREAKEFGRDTKDVLTGRTGTQPHDLREDARDAERERRRRARVYDRY